MITQPTPLTPATIYMLTCIDGLMLLVFKDSDGYQFRVVNFEGNVFGQQEVFRSAMRAEREGRQFVRAATR